MSNTLSADYRGLDLKGLADSVDRLFGFPSNWESSSETGGGSWEFEGRIVIDLADSDALCRISEAGPGDIGHIFRYIFAHLKSHHYQELHPSYDKTYGEDKRPYELDADLTAGWICASAKIPNSFRTTGTAAAFNDFGRQDVISGANEPNMNVKAEYPWPEERELAFRRGARIWAAGQVSHYNPETKKQGMADETFSEFLAQVPTIVIGMWNRHVPKDHQGALVPEQRTQLQNGVPVASGSR